MKGRKKALAALTPTKPALEIEIAPMGGEPQPEEALPPVTPPPMPQPLPSREERLKAIREQEERARALGRSRTKAAAYVLGILAILLSLWHIYATVKALEELPQQLTERVEKLTKELTKGDLKTHKSWHKLSSN